MCDNIGEFKLCTCSDKIDKKKPYWKLEKFNANKNEIQQIIMGTYTFYFFENNRELFNQVPLQYIASMLGMTPETFSRIRKKQLL